MKATDSPPLNAQGKVTKSELFISIDLAIIQGSRLVLATPALVTPKLINFLFFESLLSNGGPGFISEGGIRFDWRAACCGIRTEHVQYTYAAA